MDLFYNYTKKRRNFGRQPIFCEVVPHLIDTIAPDKMQQNNFILRNPVNRECQACTPVSKRSLNTPEVQYATTGTQHREGGWPKKINFNDEEATSRHCRRIERGDDYINALLTTVPEINYFIEQNNGIDMHKHYFKGMPETQSYEKPNIKLNNLFQDPIKQQRKRSVACIDWTYENESKLVVAYCDKSYPVRGTHLNSEYTCYLWNVEDHNEPLSEMIPPAACWQLACSPCSPETIIGGLADGRVCIFDLREKKSPVVFSDKHFAHRDPVTALQYKPSRLNNVFFSGSSDGQCLWYDIRNLLRPTDSLIMSLNVLPGQIPNIANAEPVNVLHFDYANPSVFYCGTGTGLIINVNRKGKSHQDMLNNVYRAHKGAVKAVHPSPCSSKTFISCGDWAVHFWSKDIKSSPILTGTSQRYQVEDVIWAPRRFSCYISVGSDGKCRFWDVLRKFHEPIVVLRLAKCSLLNIKYQANNDKFIAIGDKEGSVHLLCLSNSLITPGDRERELMSIKLERETHRQSILEFRYKELRLKTKAEQEVTTQFKEIIDQQAQLRESEENYRQVVINEIRANF